MKLGAMLHVYKGEWGLPSIDFECLRTLCLVKFTRCPVKIQTGSNPLRSGAGKLPYLQIGNEKFVGYRIIKRILDKEGYPIDVNLDISQKHLSITYTDWVFTNLHAYYTYFLFGEPNNYDTLTRGLYAKRTPFPFNFYYPSTYQKQASNIILVFAGFDINDKLDKHESDYLVDRAKKCVNLLSKKLGRKVWFFGNYYSEFDAIVYAYLSVIFKITLPNNPLQNHIKGCQNLVNFINRVTKDIFKDDGFTTLIAVKGNTAGIDATKTTSERSLLESEKYTKIFAGIGAILAMGAFAAWRGLYNQFTQKHGEYDGTEYDDEDVNDGSEMN